MVRVTKVAVWKLENGEIYEDQKSAERAVREAVIEELMAEKEFNPEADNRGQVASWVAEQFTTIETRVKTAMAGA